MTNQAAASRSPTPSQTVGPFFSIGLCWPGLGPDAVPAGTPDAVWLRGRVYDGAGEAVSDALVETWQYADGFQAFGRSATGDTGAWAVRTRPVGPVSLSVLGRGLLDRVVTRIYLPGQPTDPTFDALPPDLQARLLATPSEDGYTFDIHLQGPHETVFFAV